MEHAEFRRLFGANPKRTEPEVLEHRASCPECAKYAADMQRIDQMLARRARRPGARRPDQTPGSERSRPPGLPRVAASVLVVIRWPALRCG